MSLYYIIRVSKVSNDYKSHRFQYYNSVIHEWVLFLIIQNHSIVIMACRVIIFAFVTVLNIYLTEQAYFLKHDYIHSINKVATTWKVRQHFYI